MYEPITIKDIAKALGLSTSTVSRALRGSYEISPETKKLVIEYAEQYNYRPNPIALSLKERRSRSIGVVVCEIANNFFSQAINGIESIAYNRGYHVIISQSHESYEREVVNVEHLASRSVDGLLVSLSSETDQIEHFRNLHEKGFPIVFFDRIAEEIETFKVVVDNYKGAYNATKHLIDSGYTRIAHVTSAQHLSISKERLEGYKAALADHGIALEESLIRFCNHGGMIYAELEEAVLTKQQNRYKPDVARKWVELVYEGFWHDPLKTDLEAFLASSQRQVNGDVVLETRGGPRLLIHPVGGAGPLGLRAADTSSRPGSCEGSTP